MKTVFLQQWVRAALLAIPLLIATACGPAVAPTAVRGDTGQPAADATSRPATTEPTPEATDEPTSEADDEPTVRPTNEPATESTQEPLDPDDEPSMPPAQDKPEGTPVRVDPDIEAPDAVTDAVRSAAARDQDVDEDEVEIVSANPTEFSSSALGCPEPGKFYQEVIVPGYIVVVEIDGERHEYHTDRSGDQLVLCDQAVSDRELEDTTVAADEEIIEGARDYLSETTGLPGTELTLLTAEEVEWPDGSLGCPEAGMMYAQVITPGYRLVFESPAGEQFEVHTDAEGTAFVTCAGEEQSQGGGEETTEPTAESGDVEAASEPEGDTTGPGAGTAPTRVLDAALQAVADATGLAVSELEVLSWEPVSWSDSSLGCPQPGMNYLMVITPGYRFSIRGGDTIYDVHTDERGYAVICPS